MRTTSHTEPVPRARCVGFVGLGMMGAPMAENILQQGHDLVVYDLDRTRAERLVGLGAVAATSVADVARHAGILICMVETSAQAEAVIAGPDGLATAAQAGDLVILMSTIDWVTVRRLGDMLQRRGIAFIDAPVAGMRLEGGAKGGALRCFVGGAEADFVRARTVLGAMAGDIEHFGPVGAGTAFKLLHAMVLQASRIVVAEAFALGAKAGLDPAQMIGAFSRSHANSGALQNLAVRVMSRNFDGIRMGVTLKDVELQIQLGKALGMPTPMTAQGQLIYQMARAMGLEREDGAAVIKVYESWTGVPVAPAQTCKS